MNANERIERTVKGAIEMAATRREQYREYQSGTPFGMGTATNEEFAAIFEERINGRMMRDQAGFPVLDEMRMIMWEVPPDPDFVSALVATSKGKPIVQDGMELLKRYERVRMGL